MRRMAAFLKGMSASAFISYDGRLEAHPVLSKALLRIPAVFLLEPERTQFDLRWRMLGTDIRVHPMFWLVSAILGWTTDLSVLALWVGCVFVSILLHEFGHVFAGRLFGAEGHIVLYSFGGLAVGSSNLASRWQRIVAYFAGPFVQLVLFAVLYWGLFPYLIYRAEEGARFPRLFVEALDMLVEINL